MRFGAAGAAEAAASRAARKRRRSGRRPLKPPGGQLGCARYLRFAGGCRWFGGFLQGVRRAARPEGGCCTRSGQAPAKPGRSAGRMGGGMRCVFCRELQGAGAARAARQRRRSGRRPLKPPGGRLGCARCLRFAGGCGADAKPRGRPVRRGTDTRYLSPQIQPGKEPLWQTGKSS